MPALNFLEKSESSQKLKSDECMLMAQLIDLVHESKNSKKANKKIENIKAILLSALSSLSFVLTQIYC